MADKDLFYGFTPEDLRQILEILGILAAAITLIVVVAIPLIHMANKILDDPLAFENKFSSASASANPTKKEMLQIWWKLFFEEYLISLRQTFMGTLKKGAIGVFGFILLVTVLLYVRSTPLCRAHSEACDIWGKSIPVAFLMGAGVYAGVALIRHVHQHKMKSNFIVLSLYAIFIFSVGNFTIDSGWQTLFGGNCAQHPTSVAFDPTLNQTDSNASFSPGSKVRNRKDGLSISPRVSGYCIPVGAPLGARATVVSSHKSRYSDQTYVTVRWDEQPFREHSWLGFVLNRQPQLRPFKSDVMPGYLEAN